MAFPIITKFDSIKSNVYGSDLDKGIDVGPWVRVMNPDWTVGDLRLTVGDILQYGRGHFVKVLSERVVSCSCGACDDFTLMTIKTVEADEVPE